MQFLIRVLTKHTISATLATAVLIGHIHLSWVPQPQHPVVPPTWQDRVTVGMTPAWPVTLSIVKSSFLLPIEWGKCSGQDQGLENLFCWNGDLLIATAPQGSAPLINHGELHPSLPSAEPHQQGSQQIHQLRQEFRVVKKREGGKDTGAPQGVRDCAYHTALCSRQQGSSRKCLWKWKLFN